MGAQIQIKQQNIELHGQVEALQAAVREQSNMLAELANLAAVRERGNRMLTSEIESLTSKVESVKGCLEVAVSARVVCMACKIQALFRGHRCRRDCRAAAAEQLYQQLQAKKAQSQAHSKKIPSKSGGKRHKQYFLNFDDNYKCEWDLLVKSRQRKNFRTKSCDTFRTETYHCGAGIRLEDR